MVVVGFRAITVYRGESMTKSDIVRELTAYAGGKFVTKACLVKFMGVKRTETVGRYVSGLQAVDGKYYFIPEVAEKIMSNVTTKKAAVRRTSD